MLQNDRFFLANRYTHQEKKVERGWSPPYVYHVLLLIKSLKSSPSWVPQDIIKNIGYIEILATRTLFKMTTILHCTDNFDLCKQFRNQITVQQGAPGIPSAVQKLNYSNSVIRLACVSKPFLLRIQYTKRRLCSQVFLLQTVETGTKNHWLTEATHVLRRKIKKD